MKELTLIDAFASISADALKNRSDIICGIGDDTAVIDILRDNKYLLWTKDSLVENIHFNIKDIGFYNIGRKAMAVNLSDIAAMGGTPKFALVSISAPAKISSGDIEDLYKGITDIGIEFDTHVVGGDTTGSADKLFVSVSIIGEVSKDDIRLRKNARVGEAVMVTGSLGGSINQKHYMFTPRLQISQVLNHFPVSAMMDLSDGLGSDVFKLAKASKCGIMLDGESLPISEVVLAKDLSKSDQINAALYDGEDFELLFTAPFADAAAICKTVKKETGVSVTLVGEVIEKEECFLKTKEDEILLKDKGFDHFG